MVQRRARQVHQKEERRQVILGAALDLFERSPFQAITTALVASKSGLAKGTIFIYFKTKEELFLVLAEEGLLKFFEALDEALSESKDPLSPNAVTSQVSIALQGQPHLTRLMSLLYTVLEHNVDRLTALRFREFLATRTTRTARYLEQRLPFLAPGQGLELMFQIHVLALGIGQVADPAPVVKELLQAPGLYIFDTPFGPSFERSLNALVMGLQAQVDHSNSIESG